MKRPVQLIFLLLVSLAGTPDGNAQFFAGQQQALVNQGFNPADYGDPGSAKIWLAARKETAFSDGDSVSSATEWINGWDFTQGTGASQPTYQTGEVGSSPAFQFDSVNDYLNAPSAALGIFNNIGTATVMTVHRRTSTTGTLLNVGSNADGEPRARYFYEGNTFPQLGGRRTDGGSDDTSVFGNISQWNTSGLLATLTVDYAGSDSYLYIDGTLRGSDTSFGTDGNTSTTDSAAIYLGVQRIGGSGSPFFFYYFGGYIAEVIVWVPALTTEQREAAEADLGAIYGLTITH